MQRLRFLHIPKTAGSTFSSMLRRQYLGKGHFVFSGFDDLDRERFAALPEAKKNRVVLFTGHAPLVTGVREADEATIITFLRDPVSRVKSFCQHVAEGKSPHLKEAFPPESFSLDAFLDSGNGELSNLQTKMLINGAQAASSVLIDKMSPAEARDLALENLFSRVHRFGLQEHFDESLMIFARALDWSTPLYAALNKKSTARMIDFEDRHLERIAELNALDIEVYEKAREYFRATLLPQVDPEKLERFRKLQRLASSPLQLLHRVYELVFPAGDRS